MVWRVQPMGLLMAKNQTSRIRGTIWTCAILLAPLAAACAGPAGPESETTAAVSAQAVQASGQTVAPPTPPDHPEAFRCQITSQTTGGATARTTSDKPVDDQYRAPAILKPPPDPAAQGAAFAATGTLVAAPSDPQLAERQARYAVALA